MHELNGPQQRPSKVSIGQPGKTFARSDAHRFCDFGPNPDLSSVEYCVAFCGFDARSKPLLYVGTHVVASLPWISPDCRRTS
jgi:hypothetical protein